MEQELRERLELLKAVGRAVDTARTEAVELGDDNYSRHCEEELFPFLDSEIAAVEELLEA
jgi:hypothetical protein